MSSSEPPDEPTTLAEAFAADGRNLYVFMAFMGLCVAGIVVTIVFQTIGHPARAAARFGVSAAFFAVGITIRRRH
jgi:hypothetical protein